MFAQLDWPVLLSMAAVAITTTYLSQKGNSKHPPIAPSGILANIKAMSGNDLPWFLLRTAKALNSQIFRLRRGFRSYPIVVGELETARDILSDPLSTKPMAMYGNFEDVHNGQRSMFISNGPYWHNRRKAVIPAFSSQHIKRMNTVASEKVDEWIDTKLRPAVEQGESFNVGNEMLGIMLSSISETAFEYTLSEEEKRMFLEELTLALKEFTFKTSFNPLRKVFGAFIPERCRAHLAAQRLMELCMQIIGAYRNAQNPMKGTVIEKIVNNDFYENDYSRAADVLDFMVAGHDTTAFSIAWVLKELAKHPEEQKKLRESLAALPAEEYSKSDVLKMIVKEGSRLHPIAAFGSLRTMGRDFETKSGKILPKGSIAFIPTILLHRNPRIYDEPDSFQPARWEDPTKEMVDAFLPFSLGKQNCVGQSLANAELHTVIPRICSQFHFEIEEEGRTEYFLTLKPVGVKLKARQVAP